MAEPASRVGWSHQEYTLTVLATGIKSHETSATSFGVRAAGFKAVDSIENLSFDCQPCAKSDTIARLATGTQQQAATVALPRPPGTASTHGWA